MPVSQLGYDAAFLREQAKLAREMAESVEDDEARELLLSAAERLEVLALGLEITAEGVRYAYE